MYACVYVWKCMYMYVCVVVLKATKMDLNASLHTATRLGFLFLCILRFPLAARVGSSRVYNEEVARLPLTLVKFWTQSAWYESNAIVSPIAIPIFQNATCATSYEVEVLINRKLYHNQAWPGLATNYQKRRSIRRRTAHSDLNCVNECKSREMYSTHCNITIWR